MIGHIGSSVYDKEAEIHRCLITLFCCYCDKELPSKLLTIDCCIGVVFFSLRGPMNTFHAEVLIGDSMIVRQLKVKKARNRGRVTSNDHVVSRGQTLCTGPYRLEIISAVISNR